MLKVAEQNIYDIIHKITNEMKKMELVIMKMKQITEDLLDLRMLIIRSLEENGEEKGEVRENGSFEK